MIVGFAVGLALVEVDGSEQAEKTIRATNRPPIIWRQYVRSNRFLVSGRSKSTKNNLLYYVNIIFGITISGDKRADNPCCRYDRQVQSVLHASIYTHYSGLLSHIA